MNNDDLHNSSFKEKEDKVENGLDYYPETLFIACGTEFSAMASAPKQMTEKQLRPKLKTALRATSPHLISGRRSSERQRNWNT